MQRYEKKENNKENTSLNIRNTPRFCVNYSHLCVNYSHLVRKLLALRFCNLLISKVPTYAEKGTKK